MAMAFAAPAVAADAPTGSLGGWRSPANGTLKLQISATASTGAHLDTAQVVVDGAPAAVSLDGGKTTTRGPFRLCDGCDSVGPGQADAPVEAQWDTTQFADGPHELTVVLTDTANQIGHITNATEIHNAAYPNNPSATLTIGSAVPAPPPAPGPGTQGGIKGASASSCVRAKLSMLLSQKPVRIKHRVPVLYKNKKYKFTGRLTCVVNTKRHSAAKKTKVDVYAIIKGKRHHKATLRVASGGKLTVKLASPSSRTLEFRFKGADGKTTRVRIKIKVVKAPKHHKHHKHHK
jgi:hypothetical protein